MLHKGSMIEIIRPEVLLGFLQQLLRLKLVVDQLSLLLIHLRFQATQPPIKIMLSEGVGYLLVVL